MIRFLLRHIGAVLLGAAVVLGVIDVSKSISEDSVVTTPLGETWYNLSPSSIHATQGAVDNYIHPYLWDPIAITILSWPGFVVLFVIAIVMIMLGTIGREKPIRRYK